MERVVNHSMLKTCVEQIRKLLRYSGGLEVKCRVAFGWQKQFKSLWINSPHVNMGAHAEDVFRMDDLKVNETDFCDGECD